jgi:hypothetical protein
VNKTALLMTAAGLIGGTAIAITMVMLSSTPSSRVVSTQSLTVGDRTITIERVAVDKKTAFQDFVLNYSTLKDTPKESAIAAAISAAFDNRATLRMEWIDAYSADIPQLKAQIESALRANNFSVSEADTSRIQADILKGINRWYFEGLEDASSFTIARRR